MYGMVNYGSDRSIWLRVLSLLIPTGTGLGVGICAGNAIEGLAGGMGAWAVIVLLYGDHKPPRSFLGTDGHASATLVGSSLGAGLGIVIGVVVGKLAFFSIGVGAGLTVGLLIGQALNHRRRKE